MNIAGEIFSKTHRVVYYETNVTGKISLPFLFDNMLVVGDDQSTFLGISLEDMKAKGLGWVITQNLLNVKRMPENGEILTLTTQADSYNSYFCYRDFNVYDEQGQEIVSMHTVFVMINQKDRKLVRIDPELVAPFGAEHVKKMERLPVIKERPDYSLTNDYRVRYLDIDLNQHVNNVRYLNWIIDVLPFKFLASHEVASLNIQYKKEVHYGDTVTSLAELDEVNLTSQHCIKNHGEVSCLATINWTPLTEKD